MSNKIEKKLVNTDKAPAAIGPYSQAVIAAPFVFTSGQLPVDPKTNELVGGDAANQAKQVFENLKAVLAEAGTDLSRAVKATVFLRDMNDFAAVNKVYASFFGEGILPARSAVQVARLPKDVALEIEMIALL
ncbi:RidA family protein [Sphaerochaeta sp. PS]|uniref:RidA family protein n=1 Tax=Sphaerochaeta sp. PS TaxID=3076336 RepID=UPI0028A51467|nr:RidA family protein [Sphaerochaeta sp. PS]MDT4762328.1 RidA family protein [Sphaerochaeta sp. PS]